MDIFLKKLTWIAAFITITAFLTACGAPTPEPVSIMVEMTEFAFTPSTIEVNVGQQVTLNLINNGALKHEIMFGHNVMMMNNLPNGYEEDMFEKAGIKPEVMMAGGMGEAEVGEHEEGHVGFMVLLPSKGDKASITFTVTENMVGEWEMGCFEQDGVHYTAGMVGKFIVNP